MLVQTIKSLYQPETFAIVSVIDDMGTIHVQWESGSNLGLIYRGY